MHHTDARKLGGLGGLFPRHACFRKKSAARRTGFIERFGTARTVVADGTRRDQHLGLHGQLGQRLGNLSRAFHATVTDGALALGGPAARSDVLAGQMHHRVDTVQELGVQRAILGVPCHIQMLVIGLAAHDATHLMTTRGQERAQLLAHHAACAAHRHAQRLALRQFAVPAQVVGCAAVSPHEGSLQIGSDDGATQHRAQPATRQAIGHMIFQRAAIGVVRQEAMLVHPLRERPLHLTIHESAARLHLLVARQPVDLHGPLLQSQRHGAAIGDAATGLQHARVLPWWHQALQRTRAKVPGRQAFDGCGHDA